MKYPTYQNFLFKLFVLLLSCIVAPAETLQLDKLKANFILGICDFSKWTPEVEGKKIIGIAGSSNLYVELITILKSKPDIADDYSVIEIQNSDQLSSSHVIYVGREVEEEWIEILRSYPGEQLIRMGDSDTFLDQCGAIQFVVFDNRLTFNINLEGIPKQVKLSSKLLRLSNNL